MRLAVNLRLYVSGKIGGMENYVRNVLTGIGQRQRDSGGEWTVFALQEELDSIREFTPGGTLIPITHGNAEGVINQELESKPYDLLFCPLLILEPLRSRIPCAVTIPDLQHEFFPEFFDKSTLQWRRQTFQPAAFYADVVFTISEYSKSTIVQKFGVDASKVVVVGLDVDPEFRNPAAAVGQRLFQELGLPNEYIYFPANFWKHKNHSNLLRALKIVVSPNHPDLSLVLTGAPTTGMDRVKAEAVKLGLASNVHFLGYQSRAVVAEIYRHSRALVFATLFEGFGIPILEAFHTGTPVVAAKGTCCPEIAGEAAVLVDENNPAAIAAGIEKVLEDEPLRRRLAESGRQRASLYKWTQAVDLTLRTFESVVSKKRVVHSAEVAEQPLVSIVTPTFNMGRFLEETIQSVLSQDYPRIDYIVMDGGSTDGTLEILRKYEGRLRYKSEPDKGQADAINQGFNLSRGEIFTFLNADDTYLPGAVSTAVRHLTANRNVGAVYGDAYHVQADGTIIGPYPTRPFDYDLLSRDCYICQPAAFLWRDAFEAAGWMNADLQTALDYDLWIRVAKLRPLLKIDEYLATSRLYRENKTISKRGRVYREIIQVVSAHYSYVPYDWIYGYAAYLTDRKDQIFEISRPSVLKQLAALLLGCYVNRAQVPRFCHEWYVRAGYGGAFTGRWDDGWISKRYDHEVDTGMQCQQILISGRHLAPFPKGLRLEVRLNGSLLDQATFLENGPFCVTVKCPESARGRVNRLTLECNRSFRPHKNGDHRPLSCLIDSISVEGDRGVTQ